jgi:hypothetical protein
MPFSIFRSRPEYTGSFGGVHKPFGPACREAPYFWAYANWTFKR